MAGRGGVRAGAGRPVGVPNKATLERLAIAERAVADAKASGKKLAKEVLEDFMHLFAGMAAYYQPTPSEAPQQNRNGNETKFRDYAVLACSTAADLAKYQSPTFKAIVGPFGPNPMTGEIGVARQIEGKALPENVEPMSTDPEVLQTIYRRRIAQIR